MKKLLINTFTAAALLPTLSQPTNAQTDVPILPEITITGNDLTSVFEGTASTTTTCTDGEKTLQIVPIDGSAEYAVFDDKGKPIGIMDGKKAANHCMDL